MGSNGLSERPQPRRILQVVLLQVGVAKVRKVRGVCVAVESAGDITFLMLCAAGCLSAAGGRA